jgi:hypothetical protein
MFISIKARCVTHDHFRYHILDEDANMQKYYNKHRFFHIVVFRFLIPVNIYDQDDLPFD